MAKAFSRTFCRTTHIFRNSFNLLWVQHRLCSTMCRKTMQRAVLSFVDAIHLQLKLHTSPLLSSVNPPKDIICLMRHSHFQCEEGAIQLLHAADLSGEGA